MTQATIDPATPVAITVRGRTFTAQGPLPSGAYVLTGAHGADYLAVQAYIGDPNTFKVLGGRYWTHELRIDGNLVRLTNKSGVLAEAVR